VFNKSLQFCFLISFAIAGSAAEITGADIANGDQHGNWLSYGHSYNQQRFSPDAGINRETVSRLGLTWHLDLDGMRSLMSTPLVVNGVMYFSGSYSMVYAVNAADGELLWQQDPETLKYAGDNRRVLWDFNRGLAYWQGKIFVGTGDGRLLALDAETGQEIWSALTLDRSSSRTITGAPLVFNNTVIIGHGGADWGPVRGYVTAYDTETGAQRWRFYTVPGNPADGFESDAMAMAAKTWTGNWWQYGGGGTVWNAMTYDPEFNRIYLGTGNGSPWNRKIRSPGGGDNLFLCSIVALDADTGAYVWHYQTTPGETWDFNSAMDIVLADLNIDGKLTKVLLHAPKNGFFYVIDRATGKLISAEKFGKVTWADHVDRQSGRPVETANARYPDGEVVMWPSPFGAHSWPPMSFNPHTGLVYIPYQEIAGLYNDQGIDPNNWQSPSLSAAAAGVHAFGHDIPTQGSWSALIAWDPLRQQQVWKAATPGLWNPGTLTTGGDLVFQGRSDGEFVAYAAQTGEVLWRFNTGLGISAPPVSYTVNNKPYVALLVGWGGAATALGGSVAAQHGWQFGRYPRRLLAFALDGRDQLPAFAQPSNPGADMTDTSTFEPEKVESGRSLYAEHCGMCHGSGAVAGGFAPDIRYSPLTASQEPLSATVRNGRPDLGMPPFPEFSDVELGNLREFLLQARVNLER